MRHPNLLNQTKTALMIVDMQEPFLRGVPDKNWVIEKVQLLIHCANVLHLPMIVTHQNEDRMGGTIPEILNLLPTDIEPINKMTFSCCGEEKVIMALQETNRTQICVCGIETHICVNQTVFDLLELGYEAHVPFDAVSGRSEVASKYALERMAHAGAVITSTESIIYELLYTAGTVPFKKMLSYLK